MADESSVNRFMLLFGAMIDQSSFAKTKVAVEQKTAEILTSTKKIYKVDASGGKQLDSIVDNFSVLNEHTRKGKSVIEDFGNAMRRALIVAPVWMIMRTLIQGVTNTISEQIKFLKDMEMAMARIKVVGKGTAEEYDNLKISLLALSVAYGVSASKAVEVAKIFAQQGRTVQETFKLTRQAMLASVVLGEDIKDSVNNITAALEGFKIPIEDSITVIDKWINVEKQFAVTSKDLADATKTAGATANQLGVTVDSFLGDITSIIEVTRKSGTQAANALQFIYARVFTTGKKALENIAKVPLYLNAQGKATTEITKNYRGLTDILEELAGKWGTFTEKEKLAIAENIASKRQLASFMALMQNYDTALNARIVSLSSAGAAENAFGIIQDTVAIKLERLQSSWNSLTVAIADTSAWKSSLDIVTAFIQTLTELANVNQAIATQEAKNKDANLKNVETTKSQLDNLEKLVEMRDKYLARPPSDKNVEAINKINKAIKDVSDKMTLNIDVNDKDFKDRLAKIKILAEKNEIKINVNSDYNTKVKQIKEEIKNLNTELKAGESFLPNLAPGDEGAQQRQLDKKQKITELTRKIADLEIARKKEIETQTSQLEIQKQAKADMAKWAKEEASAVKDLTDKELEQIANETELNDAKASGVRTAQQLLDLEIAQVDQSKFLYDEHDKALKLAELEAKRSSAILEDLEKRATIQSEMLKFAGASESAVLAQEMGMKALQFGEDYIANSMSDRLKLAQSITKEMEEQNKKSSYLVELFKIAKKYGIDIAQEFAVFLAGGTKFEDLSKKTQEVVKKTEPKLFEEQKATEFFKDEKGFKFPEALKKEQETRRNIEVLNRIDIQPININVDIDSQRILQQITEAFINELDKKESDFAKAINKKIESF